MRVPIVAQPACPVAPPRAGHIMLRPSVRNEKTMRRNRLRELLAAGKPTMGTHILLDWPTIVELIGLTGLYDYVEFTAEYAPFTMHDLDNSAARSRWRTSEA